MDLSLLERQNEHEWLIPRQGRMRVPGLIFASEALVREMDHKVHEQVSNVAALPGIVSASLAMPDAHWGYGFTVGGVAAFDPEHGGVVSAGGVGFDISCGVRCLTTGLHRDELMARQRPLADELERSIPAGVGSRGNLRLGAAEMEAMLRGGARWAVERGHGEQVDLERVEERGAVRDARPECVSERAKQRMRDEVGTLGSGNHFVEVCLDERDWVWVVLHSGSRGVGNRLAQQHIEKAKGLMKEYFIDLPDPDLAYLVEGTDEFNAYIRHMLWAQDYAAANRNMMMDLVLREFSDFLDPLQPVTGTDRINCHHNFTQQEHHLGRNVWLTRKGAIRAREGDRGIIPGSMGTSTYIVSGLGNAASYCSCSHGAGRRMSRSKARKTLDIETLRSSMSGKAWNETQAKSLIDEDPRSYKDVERVMDDQKDLVRIEHKLTQVLNYKGTT